MHPTLVNIFLWTVFSFLCGSLPFSVWIGRMAGKDVRAVGDGNPGATNALKAGGWKVGMAAFLLDVSKAAAPVGLAYQMWNWRGWEIVPVTLAPLFGSAFSPFLKFRGGRSLSVSLGIWIGLTLWEAPLVILTSLTIAFLVQTLPGLAVLVSFLSTVVYLILRGSSLQFGVIVSLQGLSLLYTHRTDLHQRPRLRKWLTGEKRR